MQPNTSKLQQPVKKQNNIIQDAEKIYSVEQIQNLVDARAFTGYSITDAKKSEKQLSVILFASKDVLLAKTTLRNRRGATDQVGRCRFTESQKQILTTFQQQHAYDTFDGFWKLNSKLKTTLNNHLQSFNKQPFTSRQCVHTF
ncbi:Hypothetical_protein [Hexamita inflata]|uniref:Hypothetical_protein n=1 Tax=Hexamita inflata TaxID=28002 RepID=A0AA86NC79_9EUKA|nr:Hypothetical protein HINF_LOCUS4420 [Hexamita inflata]